MPANQSNVNLIGNDNLSRTPFGRILAWAVTYGRYIMIGTEIVVLLAFVSRFSYDRKNSDLNEEIAQKQAILETNAGLEKTIRKIHADISTVRTVLPQSKAMIELIEHIQSIIPPDVYFESLSATGNSLSIEAIAGTTQGFSQFLANMNAIKRLKNLEVSQVRRSQLSGTTFQLKSDIDHTVPLDKE